LETTVTPSDSSNRGVQDSKSSRDASVLTSHDHDKPKNEDLSQRLETTVTPSESTNRGVLDSKRSRDGSVLTGDEQETLTTGTASTSVGSAESGRGGASDRLPLAQAKPSTLQPLRSSMRLGPPKARTVKSIRLSGNVSSLLEEHQAEDSTLQVCAMDDSEDDEMDWYANSDDEKSRGSELRAGKPRGTMDNLFPPDYNTTRSASVMWWHDDRKSLLGTETEVTARTAVHLDQSVEVHNMSIGADSVTVTDFAVQESTVLSPEKP
jgi:hypothetical protein